MVIGRGRRREHPNQHFVLLLREKCGGKNGHAQNILPERHVTDVTSSNVTDVTSGHDPSHDPPQMIMCPSPYTTIEGNEYLCPWTVLQIVLVFLPLSIRI
jgi:hypothetical protein